MKKIAWLDSCDMDSHIHATEDGVDTVCGHHAEYITNRTLFQVHRNRNYCKKCFKRIKKSIPWDERCIVKL